MCDCSRSALQVLALHRVCDVAAGLKTIILNRMLKMPASVVLKTREAYLVKRHSFLDSDVSRFTNDEDGFVTNGGPSSPVRSSAGRRKTGSSNMVIRRSTGFPSRGRSLQRERYKEKGLLAP